ncbi:MAG: hypothetical protein LRZ84_20095 [Desertifilum sp.]|nr:hypothetical protein [Desertifilum sp.]
MTTLNRSTCRRLKQLPQLPSVWEGDRRTIAAHLAVDTDGQERLLAKEEAQGECILWVDGSEGVVRAMDVVTENIGPEAIVRTLLKAIESPHSPAQPSLPQKIVVRDREIQFYLRGVLQDLGINIEYVPHLPLIDQLFNEFQTDVRAEPPDIPPEYAELLAEKARNIWRLAPWRILGEHQILAIELNCCDTDTLYVSIMGMLGEEYGILFYRSLESLKQFRATVLAHSEMEHLEEAFLKQDCLYMTFEAREETLFLEEEEDIDLAHLPWSEIEASFGTLHPLEGLRAILHTEEAQLMIIALESLQRFFKASRKQLSLEEFPALNRRYRVPFPQTQGDPSTVTVQVKTLPEVALELFDMVENSSIDEDEEDEFWELPVPLLWDEPVPDNAFRSVGVVPWEALEQLRQKAGFYQAATEAIQPEGEGFPIILIQTSKPKAKGIIKSLQEAGGIRQIGLLSSDRVDLSLFLTGDGNVYVDPLDSNTLESEVIRSSWDELCQQAQGYCGLIIARGFQGASRGNPQPKDMLALFEARSLTIKDIGLGGLL